MAIKTRSDASPTLIHQARREDGTLDPGGWEDAPTDEYPTTVIMDIIGMEGTGRSRLALTAPGPMAYINSDEKIAGVINPFARKKVIKVFSYGFVATGNKQDDVNRAAPIWDGVKAKMRDSMAWAKTTVFDTTTEGWEMCRLANFGELNPKGNRMDALYGPVNAEFRSMFKQFRIAGVSNVISIHQVKDVYEDKMVGAKLQSINTGRTKRAGFKEFGYIADVVVRTGKSGGTFTATIEKGWYNAVSEGLTLENEDITFPRIMGIITEKDEKEWS